jgi:hypothetical protein
VQILLGAQHASRQLVKCQQTIEGTANMASADAMRAACTRRWCVWQQTSVQSQGGHTRSNRWSQPHDLANIPQGVRCATTELAMTVPY